MEQQRETRTGFATWALGLFGAAIIVLLGFVLNAVYTTNGELHEMKGEMKGNNQSMQAEMTSVRTEVSALSQEVVAINGRKP